MKILIAPDKFKGSLTALEACKAISRGVKEYDPGIETILHPMADGGEGTLEILRDLPGLETVSLSVNGPLFRPVRAFYKKNKVTAFIEMATASGLGLLKKEEQNCLYTTTLGTGEMILDAIGQGVKNIFLFVGGSATNDAGMGMAAALGYRFLDEFGMALKPIGESLLSVKSIDKSGLKIDLDNLDLTVVCDVKNVLFGPAGAAPVYAPQKGADEKAVAFLDAGLRQFSEVVESELGVDVANLEGGGAAGGLAAGAVAFLGAKVQRGVEMVMGATGFYSLLAGADLVITGEGKLDEQTNQGKVIDGVAAACLEVGVPVAVVCGASALGEQALKEMGVQYFTQLVSEEVTAEMAMRDAAGLLQQRIFDMMPEIAR